MKRLVLSGLALAAALAAPAIAAPAPKMTIGGFEALPKPLPYPYPEAANADAAVAKALAKAKKERKLLAIDLGGNWCLDCRLLAGTIEQAPLKAWMAKHYELVAVDVGRFDKNLQVPARYGITSRLKGVPAVLIVDPVTNKLVNAGRETALSDARSMTPQALADWFAGWTK